MFYIMQQHYISWHKSVKGAFLIWDIYDKSQLKAVALFFSLGKDFSCS